MPISSTNPASCGGLTTPGLGVLVGASVLACNVAAAQAKASEISVDTGRLFLLAVASQVGGTSVPANAARFQFTPSVESVGFEQAARTIALMPPTVRCTSTAVGSNYRLSCQGPAAEDETRGNWGATVWAALAEEIEADRAGRPVPDSAEVLAIGRSSKLVVSYGGLRQWVLNYGSRFDVRHVRKHPAAGSGRVITAISVIPAKISVNLRRVVPRCDSCLVP